MACSQPQSSSSEEEPTVVVDETEKSVVDLAIESVGTLEANVSTALRGSLDAVVAANTTTTQDNLNVFAASYARSIADTLGTATATEAQQKAFDTAAVASYSSIDSILTSQGSERTVAQAGLSLDDLKEMFYNSTKAIIETAINSKTLDTAAQAALTATAKSLVEYVVANTTDVTTILMHGSLKPMLTMKPLWTPLSMKMVPII